MAFGPLLKEMRESAKLTQSELAERAKIPRATLANLEQSRRQPTWGTVVKLCKALGVSCEVFAKNFTEDDEGDEEEPTKPVRGRPSKPPSDEPAEPKKPRGRPRKEKE